MGISRVETIFEFTNEGMVCGVYSVLFNGEKKVFIRNDKSVGVVSYCLGKPASRCVSEIRDDVKQEFLILMEDDK
ncbi:MAG: hypothetical protein FWE09_00195 [Treponema sp.]|nr:hypothetical protein [Treponema sp.]